MADLMAHATPADLDALSDEQGERTEQHYADVAAELTLRINTATDDDTLRSLWREAKTLPRMERKVCRDFVLARRSMLQETP